MTSSLAHFVADYGYLAVLVGSIVEGETILILAGFAAHQGYLSFVPVVLMAFCGGTLNDHAFYFLGRRYGKVLCQKFPKLNPKVEKVQGLILRHNSLVIVMIRFLYGLRILGPVIIGSSGVDPWRFALFDMLGATLWAVAITCVGFFLGQALTLAHPDFAHSEKLVLVLLVGTVITFSLLYRVVISIRKKR